MLLGAPTVVDDVRTWACTSAMSEGERPPLAWNQDPEQLNKPLARLSGCTCMLMHWSVVCVIGKL